MVDPAKGPLPGFDPWDVFVPYSGLHLLSVAVCISVIAATAMLGRALRSTEAEAKLRRSIAILALCYWVAYNVWWNWGGVEPFNGLPLHICDLNGLVAPLALLTQNRWLRATLYFWAFALTLQAFVQPFLAVGPAFLGFWAFWAAHTIVMTCAVYDVAVLGFRPNWSDLGRAYLTSAIYIALIVPVDLWLGSNYGFVGNPPAGSRIPPLVEAFGAWPRRAFIVVGLAALAFVLVLAPWLLLKRFRPRLNNSGPNAPSTRPPDANT